MRNHLLAPVIGLILMLLVVFLATATLCFAFAPQVYWHPIFNILPADIQTLAPTSTTLYAGAWGQGIYCSNDHGATWITATTGLMPVNPVTL